jgi:hypothetical protein
LFIDALCSRAIDRSITGGKGNRPLGFASQLHMAQGKVWQCEAQLSASGLKRELVGSLEVRIVSDWLRCRRGSKFSIRESENAEMMRSENG